MRLVRGLVSHCRDAGVDAILGHHPHVVQPAEYYRTRRDPGRIVPIFHSLGNLTTPFCTLRLRRVPLGADGAAR